MDTYFQIHENRFKKETEFASSLSPVQNSHKTATPLNDKS